MMIHPFHTTAPTQPTLEIVKPEFEFFGRPSHAGAAPEKGINALDAMLLFYSGINAMRQQMPPRVLRFMELLQMVVRRQILYLHIRKLAFIFELLNLIYVIFIKKKF